MPPDVGRALPDKRTFHAFHPILMELSGLKMN
jgi:hypothetical protein